MKNTTPFTLACSEAGKRGAYERWKLHTRSKWTSLRVSSVVKNQITASCRELGFRSINDYLCTLNSWGEKILKHRQKVLEKRFEKILENICH